MIVSSHTGHAERELPDIDDRLVAPDTDYEIDDGKLVRVSPSDPPHAIRHSKISALLEAHVAEDFQVASDMLTRVSETSDRAPDASVFPVAPDPRTGKRQLEHLAFEVVSTESLSNAAKKASDLSKRGVRRVFAVDVERERAFEWSSELGTWSVLDLSGAIDDPTLAVPLPLEALVRAAKADDAMASALLAKRNRVLVAAVTEGEARGEARGLAQGEARGLALGEARGLAQAVLQVFVTRGLEPSSVHREQILGERERSTLERWLVRAVTCSTVDELFADS